MNQHSIVEEASIGGIEASLVDIPEQIRRQWTTMPPRQLPQPQSKPLSNKDPNRVPDYCKTSNTASNIVPVAATCEDSVDFVQALNTALCYLCWINADASVVDVFLRKYPESLILEGTSEESSARSILEQCMRRCLCQDPMCNKNRKQILAKLNRFGHYQEMHMKDLLSGTTSSAPLNELKSTRVFPQLMSSGRYLRALSVEESAVQSQALQLHVAKTTAQKDLDDAKIHARRRSPRALARSLLSCKGEDKNAQMERLKFELEMADLKYESALNEHSQLVQAIRLGHQNQYKLLRDAFGTCRNHVCTSLDREGAPSVHPD